MGHHTSNSRKLLKACVYQHQVITGESGYPNLADDVYLRVTERVSLPDILDVACSAHTHLWVVLETWLGRDQPTTHGMDAFAKKIMEQETDMEEYYPQEQGMKPNLPTLLT